MLSERKSRHGSCRNLKKFRHMSGALFPYFGAGQNMVATAVAKLSQDKRRSTSADVENLPTKKISSIRGKISPKRNENHE